MNRRKYGKHLPGILLTFMLVCMLSLALAPKTVSAKKIKLNKTSLYLAKGGSAKLKVSGTKKKVTWKSSNKKVVTVTSKGKIKAKKIGTATITAKVKGKKLKCKVTVEQKAVNKARTLRSYILKNGTYDKSLKGYYIKKKYDDGSFDYTTVAIYAFKGSKKMQFDYAYDPESPDSTTTVSMTINLLNSKVSTKSGTVSSRYTYEDDLTDDSYYGKITTAFNGKGAGLTPTKVTLYEAVLDEEENVVTGYDYFDYSDTTHLDACKNPFNSRLHKAFGFWNKLIASKKALKKAGLTMKSIGFSKWK